MNELISTLKKEYEKRGIDLTKKTRKRVIVEHRFCYYDLCRQLNGATLDEIGSSIGFNYATVLHGINDKKINFKFYKPETKKVFFEVNAFLKEAQKNEVHSKFKNIEECKDYYRVKLIEMTSIFHQVISKLREKNISQDQFIKEIAQLNPKEYEIFKERSEVILKSIKKLNLV